MTGLVVVDTDILSAILRRDPTALARAREYLEEHHRYTLSVITRYEILRGLKARNAKRQQEAFERFCAADTILPLSDEVVSRASEIYADLYRRGELIGDADILIAATALVEGYDLATNNERHFERIVELNIDNWLK
ncbi:MAG: type II toxin-antitoxin system VapC family toxin [Rubrobacteraceae bacterium]